MEFTNITLNLSSCNISNDTLQAPLPPEELPFAQAAYIVVALILTALIIADLFGNTLVVLAYVTYPKLKTTTNCFICGLAIADLLVALFGMPFWLYYTLETSNVEQSWLIELYTSFDVVVSVSSIGHLMFIGIDRYYAVTSPINHRMRMTSRKVKFIIAMIWIFSILTSFISIIKNFEYKHVLIMIIGFAVPLVVLVYCYTKILFIAISRLRKQKNRDKQLQKELRSARTVGVVTGTFFICWLPFNIVSQYFIYCGECLNDLTRLQFFVLVSSVKLLHYFNSCVNPGIYAYFSRSYRQAFQGLFVRYCKRKYSSKDHMDFENSTDEQDLLTRISRVSRRIRTTLAGKQTNQRPERSRLDATLALTIYESEKLNESTEISPMTEQKTSTSSIRYE